MKYLDVICVILIRKSDARIMNVETCLSNSLDATYNKVNEIMKVVSKVNNRLYYVHIQINNTTK